MTTATMIAHEEDPITPRQRNLLLSLILQQSEHEEREHFLEEMEGCTTKYDASEFIRFLLDGI